MLTPGVLYKRSNAGETNRSNGQGLLHVEPDESGGSLQTCKHVLPHLHLQRIHIMHACPSALSPFRNTTLPQKGVYICMQACASQKAVPYPVSLATNQGEVQQGLQAGC